MTRRTFLFVSATSALQANEPIRYIALDISGQIRHANWPHAENAVSFGSLLKPFLALSYLRTHAQAPVIDCAGVSAGCWYPPGHGKQDLVAALANSCNVYFRMLAGSLNRAALDLTCISYGLIPPSRSWSSSRLIGLGEGWPQAPVAAARAFASLARNATDPQVKTVLAGMLRCSRCGTAKGIGFACYAKTGTGPCAEHYGSGDGYAIAIYPPEDPRTVVLLGRHNTTGANTAKALKPLLTQLA